MRDCRIMTIGAIAKHFGCDTWQVRRLFERKILPPASRVGPYRVIAVKDLPLVEQALRSAGYLRQGTEVAVNE